MTHPWSSLKRNSGHMDFIVAVKRRGAVRTAVETGVDDLVRKFMQQVDRTSANME